MKKLSLLPPELIETRILFIRAQKVIIDSDLAKLYGVSTKALNQAVKRNCERFPIDFMFELLKRRKRNWSQIVTTSNNLNFHLFCLKSLPNMALLCLQYYFDRIITNTEKNAMKNVLEAYYAYGVDIKEISII